MAEAGALAFLGTPEPAVPFLEALVAAGHDVRLVVTQPDKRRGRGSGLVPSPVKAAATAHGIPVTHRVADVVDAGVERGIVVAFGRLIRPPVLEAVPMLNVHFSLLPRWRGAAPVERAILAGDTETGVGLMELEEGLDTGPVYACTPVAIGPEETADELRDRLVTAGIELLLDGLANGLGTAMPQTGEPTYAAKLEPDEQRIDWHQPAAVVHRTIRIGRAWTTFRGKRLQVRRAHLAGPVDHGAGTVVGLVVAAADGNGIELVEVQPEGKGPQAAADWRNGARPQPGEALGG